MEPDELNPQDQQNPNDQQNTQISDENQQPENTPNPSEVSFSMEDVQRAINMSQRTAQTALDQARELREENERLRQASQPRRQTVTNDQLNELAASDFAAATSQIVAREMDSRLSPLIEEQKAGVRQRKISQLVATAINNDQYADHLRMAQPQIEAQIAAMVGDNEPNLNFISIALDGLVGRALKQNPDIFKLPAGQPNNPAPTPMNAPRKPVPLSVPNARPSNYAPTPTAPKMSESMKKLKANMGYDTMSDEEFLENFYEPGQVREYDFTKLVKTV